MHNFLCVPNTFLNNKSFFGSRYFSINTLLLGEIYYFAVDNKELFCNFSTKSPRKRRKPSNKPTPLCFVSSRELFPVFFFGAECIIFAK
jgi:hypothetical protein